MAKNEISRRTFIKGLAAGAASVATLGVLQGMEYSISSKSSASSGGSGSAAPVTGSMTYTPGTYSASARGIFRATISPSVTFCRAVLLRKRL